MRKFICLGVLGSITCTAICYLVAGYAGRHPDSPLARCCSIRGPGSAVTAWTAEAELGLKEAEAACVPDEPHPVDLNSLLPDPAKLTANWQPFETIDLLTPPEILDLPKPEDSHKQPLYGPGQQNAFSEGIVPAAAIRSADEAECFELMPYCEGPERLSTMPHADEAVESHRDDGSQEEQEDERAQPLVDPRAVEERLQRILRSYLQEGCCPRRTGVDTLEFRPSDAKKGEFDRIPF